MSVISIHQPNYLPWLGYFFKISQSDIFVFLDDAQYSNKGMHNYTYIKTSNGSYRLKYPVNQKFGDKIFLVSTKDDLGWKEKHLKTVEINYKQAPYFNEVYNDYRRVLLKEFLNIAELNATLIRYFSDKLGIHVKFIYSSELSIDSSREQKILDICKALKGKVYYSGIGAKEYQNENSFMASGVELRYSVYKPFLYEQLWGEFQSNVSALDYFMNCGYDWERVVRSQLT